MNDPSRLRIRWLVAAPLLIVLIGIIVMMARWSVAELKLGWARSQMDSWSGSVPSFAAWSAVREELDDARVLRDANPYLHEQIGRLYALRANGLAVHVAEGYLRQAATANRQALRLRPASPYTWAQLLAVKQRLGEVDDAEFSGALERATTLGPWERQVQQVVAFTGFSAWDALSAEERKRVLANVERGLKGQPRAILDAVQATGRSAALCEMLGHRTAVAARCKQLGLAVKAES